MWFLAMKNKLIHSSQEVIKLQPEGRLLNIGIMGDWIMENAPTIEKTLSNLDIDVSQYDAIRMHCSGLQNIDTTGAWMLYNKFAEYEKQGVKADFEGFKEVHFKFVKTIQNLDQTPCPECNRELSIKSTINVLGKATVKATQHIGEALGFYGRISVTFFRSVMRPKHLRLSSIVRHIQEAGINALPIVAMMAFLIAIVLAYQGATQLQKFGAEIFTINLTAISVLREMGVLLTAILVAGRSGSSFAAEIGVMKLNDEVDALKTLGIDPFEVLVIPRIIALVIALPLMTFIADICGLAGGALMSVTILDIPLNSYFNQVLGAVSMSDFVVGMIKAPVFAFIIASVGTFRGMQATGSAESVGRLTTIAVVQSIFLVILADAFFSIMFAKLGF